jgi:hypothetical protein
VPQISDLTLSVLAALFELGIPAALIVMFVRSPRSRRWAVVLLGGLLPWVCLYIYGYISHLVDPVHSNFGFYAMWVMSFFLYVVSLLVCLALSLVPRPRHLLVRFVASFVLIACGIVWFGVRHG